jgi:N-methylhydantoinase A
MTWQIGVDVGGTFTDFFALNEDQGVEFVHKTSSTPSNPAEAILDGLKVLCTAHDIPMTEIDRLSHGTTVGTNALIQRQGKDVAVVTTEGFRDLLEIGRQIRPKMFSLQIDHPAPLASRQHRFEIRERIGAEGQVITELNEEAIAKVVDEVRRANVGACAVGLLFSFLNPDHERRIGEALHSALPDVFVSLSSEVQPEFREYERFSTTLLNTYLQPILSDYMSHFETELGTLLPAASVGINQSSGGLMSVSRARDFPIRTALSGPAAGAVGAVHVARLSDRPDVVTLDMGGTSADVCLIRGHETSLSYNRDVAGFPVRLPMVDINTVGAGGGSIAWFDRDGLLKVGPKSAGAHPGPACYGLGGTEPTVTDANIVLGRLSPDGLLGGSMPVDIPAARAALEPMASQIGFSIEKTAHGILEIVAANMVRAIRAISVERGHDPREFTLMPFGGAGALHAVDVARALDISEILVPLLPGILCAQGLVVSDLKEDFLRSKRTPVNADSKAIITQQVAALLDESDVWFETENVAPPARQVQLSYDMRYVGQNFELSVLIDKDDQSSLADPGRLQQLFANIHEMNYGYFNAEDPVEIVNFRLTARARHASAPPPRASGDQSLDPQPTGERMVFFDADEAVNTPIYDRGSLVAGHRTVGPAVIEQLDATVLVYPNDTATVDAALNLFIEISQ